MTTLNVENCTLPSGTIESQNFRVQAVRCTLVKIDDKLLLTGELVPMSYLISFAGPRGCSMLDTTTLRWSKLNLSGKEEAKDDLQRSCHSACVCSPNKVFLFGGTNASRRRDDWVELSV
jgi:hypothetical protein